MPRGFLTLKGILISKTKAIPVSLQSVTISASPPLPSSSQSTPTAAHQKLPPILVVRAALRGNAGSESSRQVTELNNESLKATLQLY